MIKPPFTACSGISGHWIEDASGVTVLDVNPLIEEPEAARIAEFTAKAMNFLAKQQQHAQKIAPLGAEGGSTGGRPRIYEPRRLIQKPKQRGRPRKTKKPSDR